MNWDVKIDEQLLKTHADIRLGLMRFNVVVKESDADFWAYMDKEAVACGSLLRRA